MERLRARGCWKSNVAQGCAQKENMMQKPLIAAAVLIAAGAVPTQAAPAAAAPAVRVRGTVQSVTPSLLTVKSATGATIRVRLAPKVPVVGIVPSSRAQIKDNSFLGIASVTLPNGTQQAREVVVFPEAARGTGEGSYPWDLPGTAAGHSKMTNGTVKRGKPSGSRMTNGTVKRGSAGDALTLEFKNGAGTGTQRLLLPPNIPIVTLVPGQPSLLKPGAHVFVIAKRGANGALSADRVMVGKNGLVPPM